MKGRYRVVEVEAMAGWGPSVLESAFNQIKGDEQLKQVIPVADGGGFTKRYLIVIEPLSGFA